MRKMTYRLLAGLLVVVLFLLCGCSTTPPVTTAPNSETTAPTDLTGPQQPYLYGVNYVDARMSDRIAVNQAVTLMAALGAKSARLNPGVVETGTTMFETARTRLHSMISALTLSGVEQIIVEITGIPMDGAIGNLAPYPDLEDDEYLGFLDEVEAMVAMLVAEFPEVQYWQVGNLFNVDVFLHPLGWRETDSPVEGFTMEEKAQITVDILYRTMRAIRAKNEDAVVIMPAMGTPNGEDIAAYLTEIYKQIKSGTRGSDKVDDFMNALAWHPATSTKPDQSWVDANNALYAIAESNGDSDRAVYLTEIGYDSCDDTHAQEHAGWMEEAYSLVAEKMPYVQSMHYYRLFNDGEEHFGLFNEPRTGFAPTAKGTAFQALSGGSGDLERFVIKEDQYSSGDNVALNVPTRASSSCEHPGWGWSLSGINNGTTEYAGWSTYYEFGEKPWITSPTGGGSNDYDNPEWVEFQLPFAWEINKVILWPRNDVDENFHQIMALPRWTVVEVSDDGENWTQVGELKIEESDIKVYPDDVTYVDRSGNPPLEVSFDAVTTRYVRVTFKQLCTNWQHAEGQYYVQLLEIEIIMA